jgi:hypothetical protein
MLTSDLKPISIALYKLIEAVKPLPIDISQLEEEALDFSRLAGLKNTECLQYDYCIELYKQIERLDKSKFEAAKIDVAKSGIIEFGYAVIDIETSLLKSNLFEINQALSRTQYGN